MLTQRKIFLMHERNQAALEKLHRDDHDADHDDIQNAFRRVLADPDVPVQDRVRMACSFGAVFAGLFMAGDAFAAVPDDELGGLLRNVVHDVLRDSPDGAGRPGQRSWPGPQPAGGLRRRAAVGARPS